MKIKKYLIAIFCLIVFSFSFTNIKANDLSMSNENTFQNISNDLDNEGKSVNVSTWDEFNDAMLSDDVNNINIKSNLVYTATNQAEKNVRIPLKSIKINGEGHKIDFRGISFFNNDTVQQNMNIKWNINNLDMYGRNYFGPLKSGGYTNNNNPNYGSGVITYDNVSYYGAQLCSVYNFDAIFNGKNTVNSVNSYVSPFDGKSYGTQTNQNSIESTNLTVNDNSTLNSTVDNAGVIYLDNQGSFKIGNNSHANLQSLKAGGENNQSALWIKDNLTVGNDSNLNIETAPDGYQSICNMPNTRYTRNFKIGDKSKFYANVTGELNPRNILNPNSMLNFGNNINFNQGKNSSFKVDALKAGRSRNLNLLNFGTDSSFNQEENSTFDLNVNDISENKKNLMYFGKNSNFKLGKSTNFNINLHNSSGTDTSVINFDSDNNFDLSSGSNLKINTDASGSNFYVFQFTSIIKLNFDKVKNFEINMNKNDGKMFNFKSNSEINISHQDVEFRKTQDSETHGFYGINSAYVPLYNSGNTRNEINVDTKSDLTKNSFINNFRASDFRYFRVSEETNRENNPVQKISKWDELEDAMLDPYITNISIEDDLVNDKDKSSHRDTQIPLRSIDFNGNNHKIDFRGKSYYNNSSVFKNSNIEWNIDNVDMYGQNYYGPFKAAGSTKTNNGTGTITYNNISYLGAQLTASYTYDLNFKNKVKNSSVNSYTSPFDNKVYDGDKNQVNIEATNINVLDNSEYIGTTENAGVIFLGNNGQLNIGNNSVMDLTSDGTSGEWSNYVLRMKGNLDTGRNSKLNIHPRKSSSQTAISLDSGTDKNNSFYLHKGSEVNIDDDSTSQDTRNLDLVSIASKTNILIDDEAKLNIKTSRNTIRNNNSKRKIFDVASNGTLEIGDKGALKIQAGGDKNLDLMNFSARGQFLMNNTRSVDIDARKNTHKNTNLISMASGGVLESTEQAVSAWNRENQLMMMNLVIVVIQLKI
ncbi:hypothetical protein GSH19_04365 [Lactobacillus sp. S2-2]|uniref:pectate lyase-like adhesive domain-containing protein n=1 Tax=Lactobacillus sp. S2-2 TaxID=2692917 RepID=UPI001F3B16A3|nr:pectate lyase-like adhesive domain-containing protein [Lactobacillus sp. S2-2]MCF6515387.1 hypothetical protein [Lactobacillus sp. S2-2]